MQDKSKSISTNELWARLFQAPTIDRFLENAGSECELPAFSDYISALCEERGEKPETVIRRADIERSFGYRLFSGARNPSRDSALQLAFGLALSTDETQQLLKIAQVTPLHPKVKRDAIIAFCLHNRKSLVDTQQVLYEHELPIIGGKRR